MSDDKVIVEEKFSHRKSCSHRIFIGPWDIKTPSALLTLPEQFPNEQTNDTISIDSSVNLIQNPELDNDASIKTLPRTRSNTVSDSIKSPLSERLGSSDGISFVTAQSGSSVYQSADSRPHFLQDLVNNDDEDEEIDYSFLNAQFPPQQSDTDSIQTIRPSTSKNNTQQHDVVVDKKGKAPMSHKKHHHFIRGQKKKSLLWKRAGSVFVSRQVPTVVTPDTLIIPIDQTIKKDPILCMRSVSGSHGFEPSRYKASKEARYDLLTEKWRQVTLVLTSSYISTYSSSTYFWPKQKLEHRIYLEGNRKQRKLELFLLSPLDYSFCLRYVSYTTRSPMVVTFTFKARSFLKCQEWYMQLYDMLPNDAKHPRPDWCQVYIPLLDLSVNLPLQHIKNNEVITMTEVKETVTAVLDEGGEELIERLIKNYKDIDKDCCIDDFGLCWTLHDRAEWIYWTQSSSNPEKRIDRVICPQSIEQTHRLELRLIQHTPYNIILPDVTLTEPPPVEGFLTYVSDFFGTLRLSNKQTSYFASFDHYLFYIPPNKVRAPDTACFVDHDLQPRAIQSNPYVAAVSPYTATRVAELEEVDRRMKLMREAKGLIDLTDVSYVRRTFSSEFADVEESSHISDHSQAHLMKTRPRQKRFSFCSGQPDRQRPYLEFIMENGLQIKFEAYSSETCDVWVSHLSRLIVYWKARKEAEKDVRSDDKFVSDGQSENYKKQKLADTRIWSYCLYEQCRDIVKSGVLYYKPHKRGSYSQKIFILTSNGWLLYFDMYNRTKIKKASNHERKGTLDLAGCYYYSGVDSSKKYKGTTRDVRFKNAARIYKDGLSTTDDTLACIFSIWKPELKRYFSPKRQRLRVYRNDEKLNPSGSTWTFLAPNRREKEEWVCALNTVTEHLIRNEAR